MSALAKLRADLTQLSDDVAEVQASVNRAYSAAKIARATLAKPRQLSRAMRGLITKADTLSNSTVFLTPFPVIGTLAGRIGKILRKVKSTAEKIKRTADQLDERSKPAQKAVNTILPPLNKAKKSLERAQALLRGWLAIVTELEERFGKTPPAEVEAACTKMNAALRIKAITGAKTELKESLGDVADALDGIVAACKPVDLALTAAEDVARRLRPLQGPLNELRKALRPVRWALDAVSWVTSKIIDPIVNEILKAVGLTRLVDQLERALNPFAAHLAPLQKAVSPLSKAVKAVGGTARITARLARIPGLEKQVAAGMRPLKHLAATALT